MYAVKQTTVETKSMEQTNGTGRKFSIQKKEETVVEKLSEKVELNKSGQKVKKVEVLEKKPKVGGEAFFKVQLKPTKKVQVEKVEEKKTKKVRLGRNQFWNGVLKAFELEFVVFHVCNEHRNHSSISVSRRSLKIWSGSLPFKLFFRILLLLCSLNFQTLLINSLLSYFFPHLFFFLCSSSSLIFPVLHSTGKVFTLNVKDYFKCYILNAWLIVVE